jgi:hypothetical protein
MIGSTNHILWNAGTFGERHAVTRMVLGEAPLVFAGREAEALTISLQLRAPVALTKGGDLTEFS